MMAKVVKVVAVPVVLGFASLRITHSMSEDKPEVLLSPQQVALSELAHLGTQAFAYDVLYLSNFCSLNNGPLIKPGNNSGYTLRNNKLQAIKKIQRTDSVLFKKILTRSEKWVLGPQPEWLIGRIPGGWSGGLSQLSIYLTLPQEGLRYSEEQPGLLQSSLSKFRWSLQSYVQKMKSAYVSVKVTAVNLYYGGADVYHFLKDPPSGFVPRISVISVSGLAGMILARKGSYLKRLGLPLSLASAGFALCYPVQMIAMLKVSGKKMYAVASLWKQDTLPAVPVEGKLSSASSLTAESQPDLPCLQLSGVLQTPTAVPETQECEADLNLMDFGQSYPEDADLYSTRS